MDDDDGEEIDDDDGDDDLGSRPEPDELTSDMAALSPQQP